MSLISRSTGIHNHLAPRKKHLTPHSASHTAQTGDNMDTSAETPQRERPFAPLKFDSDSPGQGGPAVYKSIFQL